MVGVAGHEDLGPLRRARTRSIGSERSATSRGTARRAGSPERAAPAGSSSTTTQSATMPAYVLSTNRSLVTVSPSRPVQKSTPPTCLRLASASLLEASLKAPNAVATLIRLGTSM